MAERDSFMDEFAVRFLGECVGVREILVQRTDRPGAEPIMRSRIALPVHVMRMNLKVPFAEKDQAKKLGARWDAARKLWYIEGQVELAAFSRWSPTPHITSAPPPPAPKRGSPDGAAVSHVVHVGSRYVELPRVCDCLPWEDCDKCRRDATSN